MSDDRTPEASAASGRVEVRLSSRIEQAAMAGKQVPLSFGPA